MMLDESWDLVLAEYEVGLRFELVERRVVQNRETAGKSAVVAGVFERVLFFLRAEKQLDARSHDHQVAFLALLFTISHAVLAQVSSE